MSAVVPAAPEPAAEPEPKAESEAATVEQATGRGIREIVHAWIPLAIALVSVFAAVMGWRASLADESSTHREELSRQDLVHQQQLLVQDHQAVDTDVSAFGQFTQYSVLAHSLLQDANKVTGSASDQLLQEGQADLGIARYLGKQIVLQNYTFDPSSPNANAALRSDGTYAPGHPYDAALALNVAENGDTQLHGLSPEQLHASAEAEHTRGVDLTGIAALFVGVIVLLTFGAIVAGPAKLIFAGSGGILAAVGALLFFSIPS